MAFVQRRPRRSGPATPPPASEECRGWDVYLPQKDWSLVALGEAAAAFASRATMAAGPAQVEIPREVLEKWSR